jgi:predicted metal-binding membrane protein
MIGRRLEWRLRREQVIVALGLVALAALGWLYTVWLATGMDGGEMPFLMAMPRMHAWTSLDLLLMALMWMAMMVAMMTPAAMPLALLYLQVRRRRSDGGRPGLAGGLLACGYLAAWMAFSVLATLLQWGLHDAALLIGSMGAVVPALGGAILVAAGLYQFTPWKHACLSHCRSPIHFLVQAWRPGLAGAFRMGIRHGLYCVGCCWLVMTVLFVTGIMNLIWIAILAIWVLLERLLPHGDRLSRVVGLGLIGWGSWVLAGPALS